MFQEKRLVFMYATSPVHMGSGTSLGVIDNPIQRERHTGHPLFAGSGIKGAAREQAADSDMSREEITKIFGPESSASDHAGAVSFADAQVVAFPVRSLKEGFVYATCPLAMARLARLAGTAGCPVPDELPSVPGDRQAVVADHGLLSEGKLVLESYEFDNMDEGYSQVMGKVAGWLAGHALPDVPEYKFFREKVKKHLVLLSDTQFGHFVANATVVEPHVRIDDTSGTADEGGLFFTENVPPESIFVSLLMSSPERRKKGSDGKGMDAVDVINKVTEVLDSRLLQIGGDATTGRGQVVLSFAGADNSGKEG
ncbi:type III-B CRISPR module RAMP protein Cmr4 [Thermodesulfobacteriota bacterium B35]